MNKTLRLAGLVAAVLLLGGLFPARSPAADREAVEDASRAPGDEPKPGDAEAVSRQRRSGPRIMVVVPETLLGRPRVPDPAGETELIRRMVEARLQVLDSSAVARIRYSEEMGHIIKEADIKAMKALCAQYGCDLFVAGEAFSEQVNERPAHEVVPISARARIEVKAFIVETGEILAADAEVDGATDLTPAIAGKTALQNAATKLADYLIPRIREAINEGRVVPATPVVPWREQNPPYLLYWVGGGMAVLVLVAMILALVFQHRRPITATVQTQVPPDPRLSGHATHRVEPLRED